MINLKWFDGDTPDVPDAPGIGGVLAVYEEHLDGETVLRATYREIVKAMNRGWIVAVFDGVNKCTIVTETSESGGEYTVELLSGQTFTCYGADDQPFVGGGGDNTVGSAVVGTATAG